MPFGYEAAAAVAGDVAASVSREGCGCFCNDATPSGAVTTAPTAVRRENECAEECDSSDEAGDGSATAAPEVVVKVGGEDDEDADDEEAEDEDEEDEEVEKEEEAVDAARGGGARREPRLLA